MINDKVEINEFGETARVEIENCALRRFARALAQQAEVSSE